MSDDFPDAGDRTTTTSFEEWLDQHAASQGISREELFERLISSYWTLNELTQLLDDSESRTSAFDNEPASEAGEPTPFDATAVGETSTSEDERQSGEHRTDGKSDHSADLAAQLESLEERVDDLHAEIEAEADRGQSLDEVTAAVATQLTELEAELDEIEATVDSTQESLTAQYESLTARVDSLESVVDRKHAEVTAEQSDLAAEQDQIRSWIEAEFGNLETILEYLVSQTDELETGITSAEQRYQEAISNLQWERDTLQSIKRDAADIDVHEGTCESCEATIDLDLLSRPYCPHCENTLSGVEKRKTWLFLSNAVVTTGSNALDGASPNEPDAGGLSTDRRGPAPDSVPQQRGSSRRQPPQQQSPPSDARPRDDGGRPVRDPSPGPEGSNGRDRAQREDDVSAASTTDQDAGDAQESTSPFEFGSVDLTDDDTDEDETDSTPAESPFGDLTELERNEGR